MLDPTTQFIVDLFLLMGGAVLAGEIATQLGQPAMVGQLLIGVVLGPTLLGPYFGLTGLTAQLGALQILATVFVLFMAGLEVSPEQLYNMDLSHAALGAGVFFLPFLASAAVVPLVLHGVTVFEALYIAITLSITALPVMGLMLVEFGLSGTRIGKMLMNVALVGELLAVTVFSILLKMGTGQGNPWVTLGIAFVSVALFIVVMFLIHNLLLLLRNARLWEPLVKQFSRTWHSRQGSFAILMVMVVGSTLFSQFLGLTYVIGAFYAGVLVTRESAGAAAHTSISSIFDAMTWGFFVPLFFALVGVEMNLHLIAMVAGLIAFVSLLTVAILSKFLAGWGLASQFGWGESDARAIGFMVGSRGAVELAMATILLTDGIIQTEAFTIIAAVGIVATIVAPIGAMWAWKGDPARYAAVEKSKSERPPPAMTWLRPAAPPPLREHVIPPEEKPPAVEPPPLPPPRKR